MQMVMDYLWDAVKTNGGARNRELDSTGGNCELVQCNAPHPDRTGGTAGEEDFERWDGLY